MKRWIGKSAVVTGASSGIGEFISKSLAMAGMNVTGLARRKDRLEKLSTELKNTEGSFQYATCDLKSEESILKAFETVEKKFGGVDVLVNNAGIVMKGDIGDAGTEIFKSVLDVNILAPTICTREALKSMRKRKTEGHIVYINSVLGIYPSASYGNNNLYSPTKFALRSMSEIVKHEIIRQKDNIRITSIFPGLVKTEIMQNSGFDERIFNHRPYIESEQVANCVVFALSAPPGTQVAEIVVTALHEKP